MTTSNIQRTKPVDEMTPEELADVGRRYLRRELPVTPEDERAAEAMRTPGPDGLSFVDRALRRLRQPALEQTVSKDDRIAVDSA